MKTWIKGLLTGLCIMIAMALIGRFYFMMAWFAAPLGPVGPILGASCGAGGCANTRTYIALVAWLFWPVVCTIIGWIIGKTKNK